MVQEFMMTFRKQVELAFAQESKQLTSVMKHKKVPVRKTKRVEKWFHSERRVSPSKTNDSECQGNCRCRWQGKSVHHSPLAK